MVRPLARQAWQTDADRIDSLERWSITAPLQADHLAELAELRAKTEAPIHGVAAPDVDEDLKTEPLAKRTDTPIMAPPTDSSNALDHFDGLDQYEITLKFGHTARAETCDRPQCKDRGKSFREGDHNCEHELPGDIHDEGIGLFYDLDADQWAIDLEPAAAEYFTGGKAARIADALRRAGIICDSLNGVTIRRPIDYCAEPEFNGAGGGL